jgi:glucokinase
LRLKNFAVKYLREHEGLELSRVSVERLTAGPAIPLIYEFYKTVYPDLDVV